MSGSLGRLEDEPVLSHVDAPFDGRRDAPYTAESEEPHEFVMTILIAAVIRL